MNKEFIPYEQAIELKELKFDEPCLAFYNKENKINLGYCANGFQDNTTLEIKCTAPLYQQSFTWFREKHKILAVIDSPCNGVGYFYGFNRIETPLIRGHNFIQGSDKTHINYEEAQLACLKQLIKIVKQK